MFKDPLEVRRQHETYRTMSATYVQAISSRKNLTGLAWGLRNGQNMGQKVKIQAFFSFFGWGRGGVVQIQSGQDLPQSRSLMLSGRH